MATVVIATTIAGFPARPSCAPPLPSDIVAHRTVWLRETSREGGGPRNGTLNDTLWWSATLQRSRLDIHNHADGLFTSTVTDPGGTGLAYSASWPSGGDPAVATAGCKCSCFPFANRLQNYSYLAPAADIVNCTELPLPAPVRGRLASHWVVYSEQPPAERPTRTDYFAAASSEPAGWPLAWPVRVVTEAAVEDINNISAAVPPLETFAPPACCSGVSPARCGMVPPSASLLLRRRHRLAALPLQPQKR